MTEEKLFHCKECTWKATTIELENGLCPSCGSGELEDLGEYEPPTGAVQDDPDFGGFAENH
jgi:hypothetical protein